MSHVGCLEFWYEFDEVYVGILKVFYENILRMELAHPKLRLMLFVPAF